MPGESAMVDEQVKACLRRAACHTYDFRSYGGITAARRAIAVYVHGGNLPVTPVWRVVWPEALPRRRLPDAARRNILILRRTAVHSNFPAVLPARDAASSEGGPYTRPNVVVSRAMMPSNSTAACYQAKMWLSAAKENNITLERVA